MNEPSPARAFILRHNHRIKALLILLSLGVFYVCAVKVQPVARVLDLVLTPAAAGITFVYGKVSTLVYNVTGVDLGFVNRAPDPDFLFRVQIATYVNERRAQPLIDMATNEKIARERRQDALRALLKFESVDDWIQPFLNELPKGGLLIVNHEDTELLNDLVRRVRAEGGIRSPLVRAYAEVVFSFMLQNPHAAMREQAAKWLSDLLAEDAIFLIIPRLDKEDDPAVQKAIDGALWDVRAISEPRRAREQLLLLYKKPHWDSVRTPLAVIMARLGHTPAADVVRVALMREDLGEERRALANVALSGARLPQELRITENQKTLLAKRKKERERQFAAAVDKQRRLIRQERTQRMILARAERQRLAEERRRQAARAEEPAPRPPAAEDEPVSPREEAAARPEKAPEPATPVRTEPREEPPTRPAVEEKPVSAAGLTEKQAPLSTFNRKWDASEEAASPATSAEYASLAEVDEDWVPEEPARKKSKSLMNYVDMVFEVKKQEVPLFANPGEKSAPVGALPVGAKGRADFEVLIGEEKWYQVKSKKGNGWANGALLSIFDLSGGTSIPLVSSEAPPAEADVPSADAASRRESTFFEVTSPDIPYFDKPSDRAKRVGALTEGIPYLATRSEKVGEDRWFLLKINSDATGWARGQDLQLANVQQPAQMAIPKGPLTNTNKKSAFAAEWAMASVKGVGVYNRPSIAGKMLSQISPPQVYRILEAGPGNEWYRIELPNKKDGWVQATDVRLTNPRK